MRVLNVGLGGPQFGGVESVLMTIARHRHLTPALEHHFALQDGKLAAAFRSEDIPVLMFERARLRDRRSVRRIRKQFFEIVKHCRFDAVLIHQSVWLWTIVARSVKKAAVPLIFWHYDNHIAERWLEWWAGFVKPDFAICISAFAQSGLSRLFPGTRSAVVCCPVALDEMRGRRDRRTGLRRSFNTPTDACVIVQVGRFARHKGHFILFDALSAMREFSNWVCWQVGAPQLQEESDYLGAMKRKAHALGIEDRIRFLGHREDIPDVLAAADIYCQPNTSPEGYGLTFIEALNNGMPVVTSGIGGAVDIIDGSGCGLLVEPGDVAGLAGALTRLVHDSALRTAIGQCGPSRAARLSDCTQQMEQIAATIKLVVNG